LKPERHHHRVAGRRGKYGVDGGFTPFFVYGGALSALAVTLVRQSRRGHRARAFLAGTAAVAVVGSAASYFYSTGPGKRSIWTEVLDELSLDGDEDVLDVGCGRGAVLVLAAQRLTRGRAVGVDVWRRLDQSGNSLANTERNAVLEGVADRVDVYDGDARELPFRGESFDVVMSNLTLHNIRNTDERAVALHEVVRVLRPGGRLRIVDFRAEGYTGPLQDAGCIDIGARRLDWRTWCGVPGHHLVLVEARTPATEDDALRT
jgi:arsenite methyltransferase